MVLPVEVATRNDHVQLVEDAELDSGINVAALDDLAQLPVPIPA